MNPLLLKPQGGVGPQLIVRGQRVGTLEANALRKERHALLDIAVESYRHLEREAQLILVEGAGSPAETNLRDRDIANMGLARALDLPVILIGDIERGHVIASLVGAHVVLDPADRAHVRGFIINKYRGSPDSLSDATREIERHTGWRSVGVVPWMTAATRLPSEDSMQLLAPGTPPSGVPKAKIAVPQLAHIANFDEFDPLLTEPDVELIWVPPGRAFPGDAALIILPGTKSTLADLEFLRTQGWDIDLLAHVRRGGRVLGICGGYQILGRTVSDPSGIEGAPRTLPGLGLLDIDTIMTGQKILREVGGKLSWASSPYTKVRPALFTGYEMHVGSTTGPGVARPFLHFEDGAPDGAISTDGRVAGCYVHGLFQATQSRSALLSMLGSTTSGGDYGSTLETVLDEIAGTLERCLDIPALAAIAGL